MENIYDVNSCSDEELSMIEQFDYELYSSLPVCAQNIIENAQKALQELFETYVTDLVYAAVLNDATLCAIMDRLLSCVHEYNEELLKVSSVQIIPYIIYNRNIGTVNIGFNIENIMDSLYHKQDNS